MGRAKLSMEPISNEKARYITFHNRKKGLKKKSYELKTLCGVEVCFIVYGPPTSTPTPTNTMDEFWPPDWLEIQPLIDSYKNQSPEDRRRRSTDMFNFFEDRNRKAEDALTKLRKKNDEAKYPTWDDRYNKFSQVELREFGAVLEMKLQDVQARVEFIKSITTTHTQSIPNSIHSSSYVMQDVPLFSRYIIPDHHHQVLNADDDLDFPIHQHQQQNYLDGSCMVNPMMFPMMMMKKDNNDLCAQLGGTTSNNSPLYNHQPHQLAPPPLMLNNPQVPPVPVDYSYYNSNVQPLGQYLSYPVMPTASVSSNVQPLAQYLPYPVMPSVNGSGSGSGSASSHMEDYYQAVGELIHFKTHK